VANGRTPEFDRLIAPHLDRLLRVAYRLQRDLPDAHDLVQDTCVAACENLAALAAADHPDRWLLRVLQNLFIDGDRRRRRSPVEAGIGADALARFACASPGPEEQLQQDEAGQRLEQALMGLEPIQRSLLVLRAEGYGLVDIERITGVGREVLRARLHRARRSLAARLDGLETSTPKPRTVSKS
jgi:RNA polymerase sigma-70 factor, ECF subfamily